MDQNVKGGSLHREGEETIYKKRGVAFLLNASRQSIRNGLFISAFSNQGHSTSVLLREWTADAPGSVNKSSEQGINVFTLKCKSSKGKHKGFSSRLKHALHLIEETFKKDKKSAVLGTIYISHLTHLWFFLFYKRKRVKLIYDATEESLPKLNFKIQLLSDLASVVMAFLELKLLKKIKVDAVTISGPRAEELPRFKKACKNSQLILTLPLLAQSPTAEEKAAAEKELKGKTIVAVIGGFSSDGPLEQALDVAGSVVECYENIIFLFMGKVSADKESCKNMLIEKDLERRVFFLPGLSYKKMMAYLENSKVGLVLQGTDDMWSEGTGENSMRNYVYMQAGLPIVGPEFCEGAEAVRKAECGMFVNINSLVDVSGAVAYLLTHPDEARAKGEKGRAAFKSRYNWENEKKKFIALLDAASVR